MSVHVEAVSRREKSAAMATLQQRHVCHLIAGPLLIDIVARHCAAACLQCTEAQFPAGS